MAYIIDQEKCIGCGACAPQCAAEAIAPDEDKYRIDREKCTECGACVDSCPVGAISKP
ncbi:MAG: 4Fe-4S binding protein [Candidatus Saganbacteria bacterium]|nr:4Fe-4S binding protein [Candidatus Saganbacteria bacterium]